MSGIAQWSDERLAEFLRVAPLLNDYLKDIVVKWRPILSGLDSEIRIFEATAHLDREVARAQFLYRKRQRLLAPGETFPE